MCVHSLSTNCVQTLASNKFYYYITLPAQFPKRHFSLVEIYPIKFENDTGHIVMASFLSVSKSLRHTSSHMSEMNCLVISAGALALYWGFTWAQGRDEHHTLLSFGSSIFSYSSSWSQYRIGESAHTTYRQTYTHPTYRAMTGAGLEVTM